MGSTALRLNQRLISGVILVTCLLMAGLGFPAAGGALQGSQQIEQPATLISPRARAPIAIYLRPAPNQPNVGYGINGDAVTVIERLASFLPEADATTAWNHIRLDHEPYTEGWVQGKFLSVVENPIASDSIDAD